MMLLFQMDGIDRGNHTGGGFLF